MPVTIMMHLFGKPGMELDEGEEVTPQQLRDLANGMQARLMEAAEIVEKLTAHGWEAEMSLYDVMLSHPYVETEAQAEEKLHDLGIAPDKVFIDEWPEEEELGPEGPYPEEEGEGA